MGDLDFESHLRAAQVKIWEALSFFTPTYKSLQEYLNI